jgi:translation initiation factor 1
MIHIPDDIFPLNKHGERICPKCSLPLKECTCPAYDPTRPKTDHFSPTIQLDRSGRKGKVVTIVSGLPPDEEYLQELAARIKKKCGSGGTFYQAGDTAVIEIQGDQRKAAFSILQNEQFDLSRTKGAFL